MDLFSSAKWLTRPFRFSPETRAEDLPLDARGMIGDGRSAALVRVDGAIDWLCLPRFDSPSVFGAILDPERGGFTTITPRRRPFESLQRYDPDTNVLETLFRVEGEGVVRLVDFMPWTNDPRATIHELHRRVDCLEGEVELEVVFDPRFGYGAPATRLEVDENGVLATSTRGERLVAVVGDPVRWEPNGRHGVHRTLRMRAGELKWMVMVWDALRPEPIRRYRSFEHLRATRQAWRRWVARLRYDGPWRHHVLRSALALKLMSYQPTGAMVAAPTTSLPEWIGGERNWDYRYTWIRDAAMAIRAANLIGYRTESREFFHFIRDALDFTEGLQVMYAVDGRPVGEETVLAHLNGHRSSRPVRIGNAARNQLQLDTAGALLDAAYLYERFGGRLPFRTWQHLRSVADTVRTTWGAPDHGIWEPRSGMRHNVHSRLMCWVALNRAQRLARLFGEEQRRNDWRHEASVIRRDLLSNGLDPGGHYFVGSYGSHQVDAALLLMPATGFLNARHPLVTRTIDRIRSDLGEGPFLRRYRGDDGVGGPEGAFILCGFWLAEVLALAGRITEAQEIFVAHAESSSHLGLLSEQINPRTGELLGNFPQAFSHLGLINAAIRIDLALRLRDEGVTRPPHLIDPETAIE
ncbi:MAG: glycoside hydrolase family 15 protein [Myxococcaceae bacterium]